MPQATEKGKAMLSGDWGVVPSMSREEMQSIIDHGLLCGKCRSRLQIAWGGSWGWNFYVLRCPRDIHHHTVLTIEPKTEKQIEGEKIFRRINMQEGIALTKMTPEQMIARANSAELFPDKMTPRQRQVIAQICIERGLDPLMQEVMIYQGRLFITIGARLRKAQETHEFAGVTTRPATHEEKEARGYGDQDYLFVAEVMKVNSSTGQIYGPFQGWGAVKQAEIDKNIANAKAHGRQTDALPIVKDPAQHAEKRAIARGLKMAFHIPLPSAEDIGSEENGAPGLGTVSVTDETEPASTEESGPTKEAPAEGEATEFEDQRDPDNKMDRLLQWVIDNKNLKGKAAHKSAREWLTNVCKIEASRIEQEPEEVMKEMAELQGWPV